jgi:hypothetical protein
MAAGSWIIYGLAKEAMMENVIGPLNDSGTPRFRMVLVKSDYTPSVNADDTWSDVSANEATGSGYTSSGVLLTMTVTHAAGTVTVDSTTDASWADSTIASVQYACIVQDADANGTLVAGDRLVAYCNLNSGGGVVSTTAGTFAINLNVAGIFTLA